MRPVVSSSHSSPEIFMFAIFPSIADAEVLRCKSDESRNDLMSLGMCLWIKIYLELEQADTIGSRVPFGVVLSVGARQDGRGKKRP